jgi:hypothetical protein
MTAGSTAVAQKVTVQLDPDLKESAADLTIQWQTLQKISAMMRATGDMLRESDSHTDSEPWTKFHAALAASRLSEQLSALFTLVDGPNDAPTEAMTKLLSELESDYEHSSKEFQALKR